MKDRYDIFVSYRRTSFDSANLIATRLRSAGYKVFFDVESLRSGKFNEQLFEVIDACTDFLLVLPQGALDRCADPEDWVRKEVLRAMDGKKNIIPVMLNGFDWPSPMPEQMEELSMYQSLQAGSTEYFDLAIKRLCESYLKSKSGSRKRLKKFGWVAVSILSFLCLIFAALRLYSIPLCNRLAPELLNHLTMLDHYGYTGQELSKTWIAFAEKWELNPSNIPYREHLSQEMRGTIAHYLSELESTHYKNVSEIQLNGIEILALMSRGINHSDLLIEPSYYSSLMEELRNDANALTVSMDSTYYSSSMRRYINDYANMSMHYLLGAAYAYMETISQMPATVRDSYNQVSKSFRLLPADIPINLSVKEYRKKQEAEMKKVETILTAMERDISVQDSEVSALSEQVFLLQTMIGNLGQN